MSAPDPVYVSRVVSGGCRWMDHAEVDALLKEMLKQDGFAYSELEGLRREAQDDGGLAAAIGRGSPTDYRAPLLRAPRRVPNPPWLGELKVIGKPRPKLSATRLEWRLYFSEPIEAEGLVVGCGLGFKDPQWTEGAAKSRQERQIEVAMGRFKNFCKASGYTYPPFPA